MSTKKLLILLFFLLIFILISILRLTNLTLSPPGFYIDESAMTYNAYSIIKTGKDEHGHFLPLFFESFGDWKEPIFVYSQIPFILIFGPNILATRLTATFWGLATTFLFSYLIHTIFKNHQLTLISFILIGLMPWHFHFSRIGFQLITLPFFFTLYILLIFKFIKFKKFKYYYLSSIIVALFFYTYYSGRLYSFLFFFFQTALLFLHKKVKFKQIIQSSIIFSLVILPAFIWNYFYPNTFFSRYHQVNVFSHNLSFIQNLTNYLKGYFSHFSYSFLFVKGDSNLRHSTGYYFPLLSSTFLLLLLGLINILQQIKKPFHQFVLFSFLTFPLASAFTTNPPHIHRIIHAIPIFCLIMILGFKKPFSYVNKLKPKLISFAFIYLLFIAIYLFQWQKFLSNYLLSYPKKSSLWFQVPQINAVKQLIEYPKPHYIPFYTFDYQPSSYYLIDLTDPKILQSPNYKSPMVKMSTIKNAPLGTYLIRNQDCSTFVINNPHAIKLSSNSPGFCIYQIK